MTRKRKNKVKEEVYISIDCSISSDFESEVCKGCNKPIPQIKRYPRTSWIECDACNSWWHCECACVSPEDAKKFDKHKISYHCAFCVLDSLGIHNTKEISENTEDKARSVKLDNKSIQDKDTDQTTGLKGSYITILDGIKNPSAFRESGKLKQEIEKHKPDAKFTYAYSLTRGGFAIHTENKEDQDKFLRNWPKTAFDNSGESIQAHRNDPMHRLILKNVDTKLGETELEEEIEHQTGLCIKAKRFKLRHSYKPIPVVLINCRTAEDLKALFESTISLNNKKIKIENYKNKRKVPTRCYRCQEYSHIASMCSNSVKCERCSEQHERSTCKNKPKCSNCKLDHEASSKACPVFLMVLEKLNNRL